MSVHWPILRRLAAHPGTVAAVDDRGPYSGARLLVGASLIADEIEKRCASDTVGLLLPTGAAFPMAALAGWMLGKVVVPLNYLLKSEELQYVVDDCGTDCVVSAGPLLEHIESPPKVKHLFVLDRDLKRGVPSPRWPARAARDDLAILLYTSGTSGRPKGVMLSHGNLAANVRQVLDWVDLSKKDKLLGVLPQFHSFGLTVLTLLPLSAGIPVVYSARFVPQRIIKLIREHRPTMFVAIPSMYGALLSVKNAGPEDFASLRFVVSGGEPLPDDVADRFRERFGVTINEGYGLTETSPVTHWCRPQDFRPHSVGMAIPRVGTRIVDPATGQDAPVGSEGEVRLSGPNIMRGYYKLPEATREAFDERGWFRTGDMGRLDTDGFLSITGRIKEMMIIGGENVFPREIEEVLNAFPGVAASGVVGQMDPIRGEIPVAFVELEEGATLDESALREWCRGRLAGYKVPREIRRLDALPRNATGKLLRRELKRLMTASADAAPT